MSPLGWPIMSQPKRLPKSKRAPLGPCASIPSGPVPVEPEGIRKTTITPRARHLLKKYGLTIEQYEDLLQRQSGNCAVCGRTATSFRTRLAIDHDHSTGAIRGLLCNFCNRRVIGRYRKETSELLRLAYEYLTRDYPGWIVPPKKKRRKHARRKRIWPPLVGSTTDRSRGYSWCCPLLHEACWYLSYAAVLDVYDLEQILEMNDKTTEDCLEYLVEEGYVELPRIKPLDFEWRLKSNTLT